MQHQDSNRTPAEDAQRLLENFEYANGLLAKWCQRLFDEDKINDWMRLSEVSALVDKNLTKGLEKLRSGNIYLNRDIVANDNQIKYLLAECRQQAMRESRLELWQDLVTVCDFINTNLSFIVKRLREGKQFGDTVS